MRPGVMVSSSMWKLTPRSAWDTRRRPLSRREAMRNGSPAMHVKPPNNKAKLAEAAHQDTLTADGPLSGLFAQIERCMSLGRSHPAANQRSLSDRFGLLVAQCSLTPPFHHRAPNPLVHASWEPLSAALPPSITPSSRHQSHRPTTHRQLDKEVALMELARQLATSRLP